MIRVGKSILIWAFGAAGVLGFVACGGDDTNPSAGAGGSVIDGGTGGSASHAGTAGGGGSAGAAGSAGRGGSAGAGGSGGGSSDGGPDVSTGGSGGSTPDSGVRNDADASSTTDANDGQVQSEAGRDASDAGSSTYFLSDLTPLLATNDWGPVEKDTSNGENVAGDGRTLTIGGGTYTRGLGVNATSVILYKINGGCTTFAADVGIDDETNGNGSVRFHVFANGNLVYTSALKTGNQPPESITLDVTGVQYLMLYANDDGGNGNDHGDWANARVSCQTGSLDADAGGSSDAGRASPDAGPTATYFLSDLTALLSTNDWGPVEKDTSNGENVAGDGRTLTINGVTYTKGLGTNASSVLEYKLDGTCSSFTVDVGIDAEVGGGGSVVFRVFADGNPVYVSPVKNGGAAAEHVAIDITGVQYLTLYADDTPNGNGADHSDWADAKVVCAAQSVDAGDVDAGDVDGSGVDEGNVDAGNVDAGNVDAGD